MYVAAITLCFNGNEIRCLQFTSHVKMQTRSISCQEPTLSWPRAKVYTVLLVSFFFWGQGWVGLQRGSKSWALNRVGLNLKRVKYGQNLSKPGYARTPVHLDKFCVKVMKSEDYKTKRVLKNRYHYLFYFQLVLNILTYSYFADTNSLSQPTSYTMDKNGDHLILERAHNTMFEFMDQIEKNKVSFKWMQI